MMPDPVSCCCWPLTLMLTTEGKTALATAAAVPDFAPGADTGLPWAPRLTAAAVPEPSSEPTNVAPIATPPAPPTSAPAATRAARRSPRRCDARGGPVDGLRLGLRRLLVVGLKVVRVHCLSPPDGVAIPHQARCNV